MNRMNKVALALYCAALAIEVVGLGLGFFDVKGRILKLVSFREPYADPPPMTYNEEPLGRRNLL
jgi:hypothetical protein